MMDFTNMGTRYVGLVAASGHAELGLTVKCVDIDEQEIRHLDHGKTPTLDRASKSLCSAAD